MCTKEEFCYWEISLPHYDDDTAEFMERIYQYMVDFFFIADEHHLLKITNSALHNRGIPKMPYLEQMRWSIENKLEIPFLDGLYHMRKTQADASYTSVISYYGADGHIQTQSVENMVDLLRERANYAEIERHLKRDITGNPVPVSPIEIEARLGFLQLKPSPYNPPRVIATIVLHSDIWFPKVLDLMNLEPFTFWADAELINNSELANLNTPRLNQFLQKVRELTLEHNGKWSVVPPLVSGLSAYESMVSETGIILDS